MKQSQIIGQLGERIKLKQKMVDLEVPMRILRTFIWKIHVVQEDNSKSNTWNASTDQTKLKTCGSITIVWLCEATI